MTNNSSDKKDIWVSSREPINQLIDQIPALSAQLDLLIDNNGLNDIKVQRTVNMQNLRTLLNEIKNHMTETHHILPIAKIETTFEKLNKSALPEDRDLIDSAYKLLVTLSELIEPEKFQHFFKKNNEMPNPSQQSSIFTVMPEEEGFSDEEISDLSTNTHDNSSFAADISSEPSQQSSIFTVMSKEEGFSDDESSDRTTNTSDHSSLEADISSEQGADEVYSTIRTNLITLKDVAKEYFSQFKQDTSRQYGEGHVNRDASIIHAEFHIKFYQLCSEKNQVKTKIQTGFGQDKSDLHKKLKTVQAQLVKLNEDIMHKIHEIKIAINTPDEPIKRVFR